MMPYTEHKEFDNEKSEVEISEALTSFEYSSDYTETLHQQNHTTLNQIRDLTANSVIKLRATIHCTECAKSISKNGGAVLTAEWIQL